MQTIFTSKNTMFRKKNESSVSCSQQLQTGPPCTLHFNLFSV